MTAQEVIALLDLKPLPVEGGYYRETYRDDTLVSLDHPGSRALSTAIFYMLTPETFSAFHRLRGPEVYHFYLGDPVELYALDLHSQPTPIVLGSDIANGQRVQHVVPAQTWQASRLRAGGAWALLGTTMAPGFEFEDYEHGDRANLLVEFPHARSIVEALTS